MNNQTKILRCIVEREGVPQTILSIAKQLHINYRTVFEDVKRLEEEGVLRLLKVGSANLCSYTYIFNEKTVKLERWRRDLLLKNKNVRVLYDRLNEIKNPLFVAVIFGSHAKGSVGKQSDIDLCIITDSEEIQKNVENIVRTIALPVHLLCFSVKEFVSMLKTTDDTVGKEITKRNIILKGIEPLYEVIRYA